MTTKQAKPPSGFRLWFTRRLTKSPGRFRVKWDWIGNYGQLIDASVHDAEEFGRRHMTRDVWHYTYGPGMELEVLAGNMNATPDFNTAVEMYRQWKAKRRLELRNGHAARA